MKNFRKFCAVSVLTLSLALPVLAGDMSAPGVKSSPQPSPTISATTDSSATALGDMSAPGANELDPLTALTLSLLEGILSLF
jgi:hypothetical protein